jgi:hypothetical protein
MYGAAILIGTFIAMVIAPERAMAQDLVRPSVTINQAGSQADPTAVSPINFTVVFSEPVTGFATGDVAIGGTAGATAAIVTGSGATYNVAVSGMQGSGTVFASIPAGVAADAAGNPNRPSNSSDNGVTYSAPIVAPPSLQARFSRKVHGGAGTFDLPLSAVTGNPSTEPRAGGAGGNHTVVFRFDKAVTGGTASVTSGAATAGTPTFSGNEMVVPRSGVTNQQYVTVAVSNVAGSDGSTGGSASVRIGFLLGDVSQNRVVTVSDLAQVNAQIAQVVTASNYLKDVNASGTLTVADKAIANTQITKALPAP